MVACNCRAGLGEKRELRTSHDDTGDGSGGISGKPRGAAACSARGNVRVLVRASSSNRAISDLPLEYVTGDLRTRLRWTGRWPEFSGCITLLRIIGCGPREEDIYDSNVGGTKNLLAARGGRA